MDSNERRRQERCPVCQGPTKTDKDAVQRCRNSLCSFNHLEKQCPRCHAKGPNATNFESDFYFFTCKECQMSWKESPNQ